MATCFFLNDGPKKNGGYLVLLGFSSFYRVAFDLATQ